MSGGSFNYAYSNFEMEINTAILEAIENISVFKSAKVRKAIETLSELMKDVEWAESGDSTWDTEMAARWWKKIYDLCCEFGNKPPTGEERAPKAPSWHPKGGTYCKFCGAEEKYWNEAFKLKK
ncbi:MAG: hypothetical protein DRN25_05380 [Thermoplasmata archaeon]|nr:MAG: hypothetical protein DRN25_05380 [Thermoplasmata archaeon]